MKKQKVTEISVVDSSTTSSLPKVAENAVLAFPGAGVNRNPGPLRERLIAASGKRHPLQAEAILPAEEVSVFAVDLPIKGARKRLAALPFALEDRLGSSIESIHAALHPDAARFGALAAVVARSRMAAVVDVVRKTSPVLFETLAIPTPVPEDSSKTAWAVWRDGARAVVRVSDGTGFAVGADQLLPLWILAGRPLLTSLGAALPGGMPARDLSAAPPAPDPADLRFDLRQGAFAPGDAGWQRPLTRMAVVLAVGLLAHLGIAVADLSALNRLAAQEKSLAQAAIATRLPGVDVDGDPQALAARLVPRSQAVQGSAFLPLFGEISAALIADAPAVSIDRLAWDAQAGAVTLRITAGSLEDLQAVERSLVSGGLQATTGVATAGSGGAQAEMKISKN